MWQLFLLINKFLLANSSFIYSFIFVVWDYSLFAMSLLHQAVRKRHIIHWNLHTVPNTLKSKQHKTRHIHLFILLSCLYFSKSLLWHWQKVISEPADYWWEITNQKIPKRDSFFKGRVRSVEEGYSYGSSTERYWRRWICALKTKGTVEPL